MRMVSVTRLGWRDEGVAELVDALDQYQIGLYGRDSCHLESIEALEHSDAVLFGVFDSGVLIGIGAVRIGVEYAELKRVYVRPEYRGGGAAAQLVRALEEEASKRGVRTLCLETGRRHFSALRFYERLGYVRVESFGSYVSNPVSIYMRKELS